MMECDAMRPILAALADGELDIDRREDLERHATECASCAGALADYRAIRAAASLAWPQDQADLWGAVAARLDTELDTESLAVEMRRMREEISLLRAEIAEMRSALPVRVRSTSLDLPYIRRVSPSPFQLV